MEEVATLKPKKKRIRRYIPKSERDESPDADPRRAAFAAAYYDPLSNTYGQLVPSGLKAGFTATYSQNLTTVKPQWLVRIIEKMDLMTSVKRNIKKHLDLKTETVKKDKKGNEVVKEDPKLLKIQQDMTIFVAERLLSEYKKSEKNPLEGLQVEIKQIIVVPPHANNQSSSQDISNTETVRSVSTP